MDALMFQLRTLANEDEEDNILEEKKGLFNTSAKK